MDDYSGDSGPSVGQSLAQAFAVGLGAYVDSQNNQPVTVTSPAPQTQYGYAGYGQYAPATPAQQSGVFGGLSPIALLAIAAVVFFVAKAVK